MTDLPFADEQDLPSWWVWKFGGSSLANLDRIDRVAALVQEQLNQWYDAPGEPSRESPSQTELSQSPVTTSSVIKSLDSLSLDKGNCSVELDSWTGKGRKNGDRSGCRSTPSRPPSSGRVPAPKTTAFLSPGLAYARSSLRDESRRPLSRASTVGNRVRYSQTGSGDGDFGERLLADRIGKAVGETMEESMEGSPGRKFMGVEGELLGANHLAVVVSAMGGVTNALDKALKKASTCRRSNRGDELGSGQGPSRVCGEGSRTFNRYENASERRAASNAWKEKRLHYLEGLESYQLFNRLLRVEESRNSETFVDELEWLVALHMQMAADIRDRVLKVGAKVGFEEEKANGRTAYILRQLDRFEHTFFDDLVGLVCCLDAVARSCSYTEEQMAFVLGFGEVFSVQLVHLVTLSQLPDRDDFELCPLLLDARKVLTLAEGDPAKDTSHKSHLSRLHLEDAQPMPPVNPSCHSKSYPYLPLLSRSEHSLYSSSNQTSPKSSSHFSNLTNLSASNLNSPLVAQKAVGRRLENILMDDITEGLGLGLGMRPTAATSDEKNSEKEVPTEFALTEEPEEYCIGPLFLSELMQSKTNFYPVTWAFPPFELLDPHLLPCSLPPSQDCVNIEWRESYGEFAKWFASEAACPRERVSRPRPKIDKPKVYVVFITGFVGRTRCNAPAILRRNGSDTSAVAFAALLRAEGVTIWSDVAGIYTGDPKYCKNARALDFLSYEEALELAGSGAKVLHPSALLPSIHMKMPLLLKSTFEPHLTGTTIAAHCLTAHPSPTSIADSTGDSTGGTDCGVKLPCGVKSPEEPSLPDGDDGLPNGNDGIWAYGKVVSMFSEVVLLTLTNAPLISLMNFASRLFTAVERGGGHPLFISQGSRGAAISVVVARTHMDEVVNAIVSTFKHDENDFGAKLKLAVDSKCVVLTIVGRGQSGFVGALAAWSRALSEKSVSVKAISQSSNELSTSFVVSRDFAHIAYEALHHLVTTGFEPSRSNVPLDTSRSDVSK